MFIRPKELFAASLMAMLITDVFMTQRLLRFYIFRNREAHVSWFEAKQKMAASIKEEIGAPRTKTV
jgi:hypothetical protein